MGVTHAAVAVEGWFQWLGGWLEGVMHVLTIYRLHGDCI
jgi:hypothetical protein